MEEYRVLLQIILLIICLFLLYLLVKYIRSIMIKNRLSDYSINLGDDNLSGYIINTVLSAILYPPNSM